MIPGQARKQHALVLVVDDDATMQLLVGEALDAAGFAHREVGDGEAALEAFVTARPDLVLLDVMMPGIDGFETCTRLRQLPGGGDVPIMMMTGSDDIEAIHRAFEAGATDFITKPLNYPVLGYRLRYMQRSREKQQELRISQQRLTDAQRLARLGHWEWNLVSSHVSLTAHSSLILGLDPNRVCHTVSDLLDSVHPDDRERVLDAFDRFLRTQDGLHVEHKVVRPDGSEAIVYQEAEAAVDEVTGRLRLTGTFQDITERKRVEQRVLQLEHHDALTDLPNRSYFTKCLRRSLESVDEARMVAVYEIAIDQLQRLNDSLGHAHADELVMSLAERLASTVGLRRGPSADRARLDRPILARDPSGVFLLLHPGLSGAEAAMGPARAIMSSLEGSFEVGDQEVFLTASIGIAVAPVDGREAEVLLRNAHTARGSFRSSGSSGFCFYARSMNEDALERVRLENALRRAVDEGSFMLHFQPKVDTSCGAPSGMEALLRWDCPGLGQVSPAKFVPIAEEHGLVVPIGQWVIRQACEQLVRWDEEGLPPLTCSVNVAVQQLDAEGFEDHVAEVLEETGLDPARLELELTERALMVDADRAAGILQRLRSLGCRIALDDFGTGYSSLSYLNRFPLDVVKLDRSFILDVPGSEAQSTLVAALIELAKKLRLEVVAEGVETAEQRNFLMTTGCDHIQGFYFSKPLAPPDLARWTRERLDPDGALRHVG